MNHIMALKLRPAGRERGLLEREGIAARPSPFHERPSGREHDLLDLLERVGISTRIAPLLGCLEEEVHDNVKTWERHNMTNHRCEITRCTAISLHYVAFHADLVARER